MGSVRWCSRGPRPPPNLCSPLSSDWSASHSTTSSAQGTNPYHLLREAFNKNKSCKSAENFPTGLNLSHSTRLIGKTCNEEYFIFLQVPFSCKLRHLKKAFGLNADLVKAYP